MELFSLFFFILILKCFKAKKEDSAIGKAISDTADELYVKDDIKFDVIMLGKPVKCVEKILGRLSKLDVSQKVVHIKDVKEKPHNFEQSAIILASDHQTAVDFIL